MRTVRTAAAALLVLAASAPRSEGQGYAGGGVGVVSPSGSFGGVDQMGWEVAGEAWLVPRGAFGIAVDGSIGQTGHKNGVSGKSTLAGGTGNAVLWLGRSAARVRVLVLGGVGAFRVNIDVPGFGSAAATKLAFDGGAGVVIGSGRRRAFLTVQYVTVRTSPETTAFIPIRAGVVIPL